MKPMCGIGLTCAQNKCPLWIGKVLTDQRHDPAWYATAAIIAKTGKCRIFSGEK